MLFNCIKTKFYFSLYIVRLVNKLRKNKKKQKKKYYKFISTV